MEDVNDHLKVIEHDPLTGGKAINCRGANVTVFAQPSFDFACYRFQMRLRGS